MKIQLYLLVFIGLTTNGFSQTLDSLITVDFSYYLNSRDSWVYETTNGPVYRYCNGKKCNGEVIDTFDNGKIKHKAFYIDGKPNGKVIHYNLNGQIESTGQCDNGMRIGTWKFYFENGNIESEITYDSNLQEPKKWIDFYENGDVKSKFEYNNLGIPLYHYDFNEKGDTTFAYYPIDFENLVYKFYDFHSNGQLKILGQQKFVENEGWVKIGVWKWFDEYGKLTNEINYDE